MILLHIHILSLLRFPFRSRQGRARTALATHHLLVYELLLFFPFSQTLNFKVPEKTLLRTSWLKSRSKERGMSAGHFDASKPQGPAAAPGHHASPARGLRTGLPAKRPLPSPCKCFTAPPGRRRLSLLLTHPIRSLL